MAEELNQALSELEEKTKTALEQALAKAARCRKLLVSAAVLGFLVGFGLGLLIGAIVW